MEGLIGAIEASALAHVMRTSRWVYALVNAAHITGIALLFGAITALDLRLLGLAGRRLALGPLSRLLLPVAICGLGLAIIAGLLLFLAGPGDYLATRLFLLKLGLIALAMLNALLLHLSPAWRQAVAASPGATPLRLRLAGGLSVLLWLSVILCGRLLGFV